MDEQLTFRDLRWPLTLVLSLLVWLFVTQRSDINTNSDDINTIQMNERTSQVIIEVLEKSNNENKENTKKIMSEITEIKLILAETK